MRCTLNHWRPNLGRMEAIADVIFDDSFESGDTMAWDTTIP